MTGTDGGATGTRPILHQPEDPDGTTELVRELRRLRTLTAGSRLGDVHAEVLALRELADRLERGAEPIPLQDFGRWGSPEHLAANPVIGVHDVVAPPLEARRLPDGEVLAELTLGPEYQGPPGCVHGGMVAMVFDEMLGLANASARHVGMTVDLRVTYVSPTPIGEPLSFRARQTRTEGRKIWAEGTLHAGERLCARVEGMFVTPRELAG